MTQNFGCRKFLWIVANKHFDEQNVGGLPALHIYYQSFVLCSALEHGIAMYVKHNFHHFCRSIVHCSKPCKAIFKGVAIGIYFKAAVLMGIVLIPTEESFSNAITGFEKNPPASTHTVTQQQDTLFTIT